ncbi:MAG: hypothetical protein HUU55_13100 [Myxococcales bacterium]|nr:hypothetical protein [Myxococcales bacterium]
MTLKTNCGEFKVDPYKAVDAAPGKDERKSCGAHVEITFTPATTVRSSKISFVQVMKCTKGDGKPLLFDNETPRSTAKNAAGGGDADEGYAVDRLSGKKHGTYGVANDGTAEQGVDPDDATKTKDKTRFGSRTDATTHKDAFLFDRVNLPRDKGKTFSCDATSFALDETNKKYLGGVKWGYDVDTAGKVTVRAASIGSMGDPSGIQLEAIKGWNKQADEKDGAKKNHADQVKLPVPTASKEIPANGGTSGYGDYPLPKDTDRAFA